MENWVALHQQLPPTALRVPRLYLARSPVIDKSSVGPLTVWKFAWNVPRGPVVADVDLPLLLGASGDGTPHVL